MEKKLVGVLGVFPFTGASAELIDHGLEHLEKDGYTPVFLESLEDIASFDASELKLNWVVAAGGLPTAQYLEKEKHIPYLASLPTGMRSMRQWRVHLAKVLGYEDDIEIPPKANPEAIRMGAGAIMGKRVLLLGDPILTAGLKSYLQDMLGCTQVTRAHYAPLASVKLWYERILTRAEGHGLLTREGEIKVNGSLSIGESEALEQLVQGAEIIISDEAFRDMTWKTKGKLWIELPDCLSSGIFKEQQDYQLFGKKGAAWLTSKLAAGN